MFFENSRKIPFRRLKSYSRYSVTGELKKEVPAYLYSVGLAPESKEPATVWIDAVQLEEGAATPFQPSDDLEVGWLCPVPGHIYYDTEDAPLTLRFYNPRKLPKAELEYATEDYYGATVDEGTRTIDLGGQVNADARFDLYKAKRGLYRAAFRWGKGQGSEIVYSVLPPSKHLKEIYPEGTLGMDVAVGRDNLRILKRANVNWIMSKFAARWCLVDPQRGNYVFDDTLVKDAQAEKMMVMLQVFNPDWGTMPWLRPMMKAHPQAAWPDDQKQPFLQAWGDLVRNVVAHFKPWVRHYEIWNEPNAEWPPSDYGLLLKTAYAAAKRGNPEAVVIGFSGGGLEPRYCEDAIAVAGSNSFDVISVHFHHNNPDVHAAFAAFLKKHNRPGWNTETGPSCPSFYANLPTFESLTLEGHRSRTLESIRALTRSNTNNYLMSLSVGGMERYICYFCRFVNSSPSQPSLRQGSTKDCVEFDGALRANGVAMSIASHFLDGAKYEGALRNNALEAHLYRRGPETVGFLWLKDDNALTPPSAGLTLYDLMGNPLPPATPHRPAGDPTYFTLKGAVDQATAALAALQVK